MDFAPPTTGLYPGQEEKPDEPAPVVDDGRPLTAQQRLAALKAKLSDARKTNHKAVVEEDRRSKLGPQGLKEEAKHKKYDQMKKEGKKETDDQKMMSTTAATKSLRPLRITTTTSAAKSSAVVAAIYARRKRAAGLARAPM